MCEFQEIGAIGVILDNLPIFVFAPSNLEDLLLSSNHPAEDVEFILANYPPNTITFIDFYSMIGMEYEATFEIGTEVPDPCDGYSEVDVNVQPKLIPLNVTENGTYKLEKTYTDAFTYNANTEKNIPEGRVGDFKLEVTLPEMDLSTFDANTGKADISNLAKDWAFSLVSGDVTVAFDVEELPITVVGVTIEFKLREFPTLTINNKPVAVFCPPNSEDYIRMLMGLSEEQVTEEEI
jgi:hypothetical protein